jgi:mannose-1-phosphate guanylyltransferase
MYINDAILLAAGKGTRLKPITDHLPKCMVEINGVPLLEIWIRQLSKVGIQRVHINTYYLAEQVESFIASTLWPIEVITYRESELKGTLGSLAAFEHIFAQERPVFVAHADNLCLCDFEDFFSHYKAKQQHQVASMMTFRTEKPSQCGIVELNENNELVAFHEKVDYPPSNLANAAVFIFEKDIFNMFSYKSGISEISIDLIPKLYGKIVCWENDFYMRDIGTLASLNQAQADIKALGVSLIN